MTHQQILDAFDEEFKDAQCMDREAECDLSQTVCVHKDSIKSFLLTALQAERKAALQGCGCPKCLNAISTL